MMMMMMMMIDSAFLLVALLTGKWPQPGIASEQKPLFLAVGANCPMGPSPQCVTAKE
jgi:hypothetical protein